MNDLKQILQDFFTDFQAKTGMPKETASLENLLEWLIKEDKNV